MKKFSFIILKKGNIELPNGVLVECEAPEWEDLATKENFIGDVFDVENLKAFLQTAYCMYGHGFNINRHTPRQLYEALICNNTYHVSLEGDIPDNPLAYEELSPEECD